MKKNYLSLVFVGCAFGGVIAQNTLKPVLNNEFNTDCKVVSNPTNVPKAGVEIWSNNFDNPTEWTVDNDGQTGSTFGWTIDATSDGWRFNGISSTSGGNYAEVSNGDPTVDPGTQVVGVEYTLTYATAIDIPNLPLNTGNTAEVSLQFEEFGARFYDKQAVQISTDGGATWTTVRDNSGYSRWTFTGGDPYADPETVLVNLAPFITGNPNAVWIRFSWTSEYPSDIDPNVWLTYGWYIDDVKIITNPDDDLALWSVWISGANNGGTEYGRNPLDQVDSDWLIGGQVYNYGVNDQTNVVLTADFTSFTAVANETIIASGDTVYMETTDALTLTPGMYTGNYTVVSDGETGGVDFGNNVGSREFEVTPASTAPNSIYSLDGIGVYSSNTTSSLGTESFGDDSKDGFICATKYHIKNSALVSGIRVMLASGSQVDGEIYGSIKDTATFWVNDMSSLFSTNSVKLTLANINAGYVDLYFSNAITLNPGAYYAAVELYSNGGTAHISIVDDETVPQPGDASAIYIPGDQSWSNGEAFGIRLLMGESWLGLNENTLEGVSVYPNPSEGIINITNDKNTSNVIEVMDIAGKVVLTKEAATTTTIDLSSNGVGVYFVKVSNGTGSITEKVIIK